MAKSRDQREAFATASGVVPQRFLELASSDGVAYMDRGALPAAEARLAQPRAAMAVGSAMRLPAAVTASAVAGQPGGLARVPPAELGTGALLLAAAGVLACGLATLMQGHGYAARRYAIATASLGGTQLVGVLVAQGLLAALGSVWGPRHLPTDVQCVALGALFLLAFAALTLRGRKETERDFALVPLDGAASSPTDGLLLGVLGLEAHLTAFVGIFFLDTVWQELAYAAHRQQTRWLPAGHEELYAAVGTTCVAAVLLPSLVGVTQWLRSRDLAAERDEQPMEEQQQRFSGLKACCGLSRSHSRRAQWTRTEDSFAQEVVWAEDRIASLVTAFLLYKDATLLLARARTSDELEPTLGLLAFAALCGLGIACYSRPGVQGRMASIVTAVWVQLCGLGIAGLLTFLAQEFIASAYMAQGAATLGACVTVLLLLRLLQAAEARDHYAELKQEHALRYPLAPLGLGLLLAMAWSAACSIAIGATVAALPILASHSASAVVALTALAAVAAAVGWSMCLLPMV